MGDSVLDQFRLDGKTAIVTGASRGLGRAMALALADAGANIVAIALNGLDDVAAEVRAKGVECATRALDLGGLNPESAAELVTWAGEQFPGLSILVNNAGIIRRGPVIDTPAADWSAVLDLNLTTPFLLSQAFARHLLGAAGTQGTQGTSNQAAGQVNASIINVSSINGFQGGVEVPSYAASKHGLLGLTRALANEWTARGIRVNAIAPGYFETDFTVAHREAADREAQMMQRVPAHRWGKPAELGGAAVFLASDASTFVSGSTLTVDGGWLAR
ncbi:SDR family oxidoreductase [Corynebacterium callunae]|uniref:SDR family NAD(P)-dependent oxidoreductase n=1 Tax=Corynebacterium callunae TaxID=1721 RepID=UPI003981EEA9